MSGFLKIPDEVFGLFRDLAEYDFRPPSVVADMEIISDSRLIDVEILGHIFEQSINDLEKLQSELDKPVEISASAEVEEPRPKISKRKREGAFYTPAYITRYIVDQALGGVLRDRFEILRLAKEEKAKAAARSALADPRAYDLESLKPAQRDALLAFWLDWQHELGSIRILDPACGSGAFLIEAFDQLHIEYERTNDRVHELRGFAELFDLDRKILQENLYGVDLNEEAVHIAKLSLWIKTAVQGKELTSLDHNLRVGNSIVADSQIDAKAFEWKTEFPEVFEPEKGGAGFDVVIGNPPYIRQEWLSPIKPYLQSRYATYHGMADLYVYFYELGLSLLRPGGRLSYVVTNKWMKAGYGEPLRKLFAEKGWVESVVDFGHAKQIFEDADVFPCIILVRQPSEQTPPESTKVCAIPREQLRIDDLSVQIAREGVSVPRIRLNQGVWLLESREVNDLLDKLKTHGIPLKEYSKCKPYFGIKTALNAAYLIDSRTKDRIIEANPNCSAVIRPYLRGQDVRRWNVEWAQLWMIALKSSGDYRWPWSDLGEGAELAFMQNYPSLHAHMKLFEPALRGRADKGRYWWELRSCAYWQIFDEPNIIYQDLSYHSRFSLGFAGLISEATCFSLPTTDSWLLAVLNSPLIWWLLWRETIHGKDEVLRLKSIYTEKLPIAIPSNAARDNCEQLVRSVVERVRSLQSTHREVLDWLRIEHGIIKPNTKLESAVGLDSECFVSEIRKVRGKKSPLSLTALRTLREEHVRTVVPAQTLAKEVMGLERRISDLVNQAYGLTREEVELMWSTAPPRMPIRGPTST